MNIRNKLLIIILIITNLFMIIGNISFATDSDGGKSFSTKNAESISVSFENKTIEAGKDIIVYIKTDKSIRGRKVKINDGQETKEGANEVAYINEDGIYCYQYYIFKYQNNKLNDLQIESLPKDDVNIYVYVKYNNQIIYAENIKNTSTQSNLEEADNSKFLVKPYYTTEQINEMKTEDTKIMKQKWADGLGIGIDDVDKYVDMYNAKGLGKLHKDGKKLKNSKNEEVQLNGVGLFHLLDYGYMYNEDTLKALKYWGVNCLRLPAYVQVQKSSDVDNVTRMERGLDTAFDEYMEEMDRIIDIATEQGLYCMVDFHILEKGGDILKWSELSENFFKHFLEKYGKQENMIWEIANEPHSTSNENLETYINNTTKLIKKYDENPVIICGSNKRGGRVSELYQYLKDKDCINDIFISAHYYNGEDLESSYTGLYKTTDIPLMFTEWSNASSSTTNLNILDEYTKMTKKYFPWWNVNNISNCVWMYCHGNYTYSLFKNLGEKKSQILQYGMMSDEYLTDNGILTLSNYLNVELSKIKESGILNKDVDKDKNDSVNNVVDNKNSGSEINNVVNNESGSNNMVDSTVSKNIIPYAGKNVKMVFMIFVITIVIGYMLYKNIKYKDVK